MSNSKRKTTVTFVANRSASSANAIIVVFVAARFAESANVLRRQAPSSALFHTSTNGVAKVSICSDAAVYNVRGLFCVADWQCLYKFRCYLVLNCYVGSECDRKGDLTDRIARKFAVSREMAHLALEEASRIPINAERMLASVPKLPPSETPLLEREEGSICYFSRLFGFKELPGNKREHTAESYHILREQFCVSKSESVVSSRVNGRRFITGEFSCQTLQQLRQHAAVSIIMPGV